MLANRISFAVAEPEPVFSSGFVACPAVVVQSGCCTFPETLRDIYRVAYERACETHRPSRWAPLYLANTN